MKSASQNLLALSFFVFALVGCSGLDIEPVEDTDTGFYNPYGGLLSGQGSGGISVSGLGDEDKTVNLNAPNAYLWRATLATIGFMGIRVIEPGQGTIITDWYKPNSSENEVQIIVSINGSSLRSNNIDVTQARRNDTNSLPSDEVFENKIKNAILLKARELRSR